jgi:hypothetical protein
MKSAALIIHSVILNLIFTHLAPARPLVVSFTSSPAEAQGLVLGYGLYYQRTNSTDPYSWNYISCCGAGNTNFYTDTAFIQGNPVWICGDTLGRSGKESGYGPQILFDTNVWLAAIAKAATGAIKASGINSVPANTPAHKTVSPAAIPGIEMIPGPIVSGIKALPGGEMQVNGIGASNQIYSVTASASLAAPDWIPIGSAFTEGTNIQYIDQSAMNYPQRFYRFALP